RGGGAFGSWLYRITANGASTKASRPACAASRALVGRGFGDGDEHAPSLQGWSARVEDPALQFELRTVLTAALDTLPEDYRTVLVLRDVEGLSVQEVSQITGLSVAAVKTRAHRARLVLRKCLGEHFSDRPPSLPASPSVSAPSPRRGEWSSGSTRPR